MRDLSSSFHSPSGRRLDTAWRLLGATILVLLVTVVVAAAGAVEAGAATTIGPVYPAPGSGTLTTTGTTVADTGGITWAFSGVDPTQFTQMVWGLEYPGDPATYSFGLNTATLAFDAATSDLPAGTATFTGSAEFPALNGSTPTLPLRLTVQTEGGAAFETPAASGLTVDSTVGAVEAVTGDFSVDLLLETSADGGTTWTPANSYFDTTPHTADVSTTTSVNGAFWYTPAGTPSVGFSPDPLAFGAVPVGTTSELPVTVTNTGTADLDITEIDAGGDYTAPEDTCVGSDIAAGDTCMIDVDFTPSVGGTDDGQLQLVDNTATSPDTLDLTGSGAQPEISVSPNPLDFGPVSPGTTATAPITVSNPGTAPLNITGDSFTGPDASDFAFAGPGTCTGPVAPGGSCQPELSFKPSGPGTETATLTLTSNAGTASIGLQGEETQTGATLSPASVDFGSVAVNHPAVPWTVTLTSSGTTTLDVHSFSFSGPNAADFSREAGGSCPRHPFTLAAGASCTVVIGFTPSTAADESATFVAVDDGGGGTQDVALEGTGAPSTDLAVYMHTSSRSIASGGDVTFSVAVENLGPYDATDTELTDVVGKGTGFQSYSAGVTCGTPAPGFRGVVHCDLGTLPAYSSVVVSITVDVTAASGTKVTNRASATTTTGNADPKQGRVSRSVTVT